MQTFYRNETDREYPLHGSSGVTLDERYNGLSTSRPTGRNGISGIAGSAPKLLPDYRGSPLERGPHLQEVAYPWSLQHRRSPHRGKCVCQCRCSNSAKPKIKEPPTPVQNKAPPSSSWRLLHVSRAKLKGSAATSELLAGFATVAMVELNIHDPTVVPEWLFVLFTATTSILVSVHIFALMISTYVLPNIEAIFKVHPRGSIAGAPHESMRRFIDVAWSLSTLLGLFLFLFDVAIICWIQLVDFSFTASLAGSLIMGPVLIAFMVLVMHFHKNLMIG